MEKKIYDRKSEKVIDFLLGFFLIPAFIIITALGVAGIKWNFTPVLVFIVSWSGLGLAIFLCIKRKFLGIGFLSSVVFTCVAVPLVLFGSCLLMMSGHRLF